MTIAVCVRCGEIKLGAITSCPGCRHVPLDDDDFVYSIVLSDHYFNPETLNQISASMKNGGPRPSLTPDQEAAIRKRLLAERDANPRMKKLLELQRARASAASVGATDQVRPKRSWWSRVFGAKQS